MAVDGMWRAGFYYLVADSLGLFNTDFFAELKKRKRSEWIPRTEQIDVSVHAPRK